MLARPLTETTREVLRRLGHVDRGVRLFQAEEFEETSNVTILVASKINHEVTSISIYYHPLTSFNIYKHPLTSIKQRIRVFPVASLRLVQPYLYRAQALQVSWPATILLERLLSP